MESLQFALYLVGLPLGYWLLVEIVDRLSRAGKR